MRQENTAALGEAQREYRENEERTRYIANCLHRIIVASEPGQIHQRLTSVARMLAGQPTGRTIHRDLADMADYYEGKQSDDHAAEGDV